MWENSLVSSVFKEDVQMFRQNQNRKQWPVQRWTEVGGPGHDAAFKTSSAFFMGTQYQKNPPPAKLSCVIWETAEGKMCVQRRDKRKWRCLGEFLNTERTREYEMEGKDETMSNFLAGSGQIWPRSHQPLSCLRRCWQSAKCVWIWLRLVHIQRLARRATQKKGW